MATHDFLRIARVDGDRPFTAASLPSAAELDALAQRLFNVRSRLHLARLSPEQAAALGNAPTPEEVRLNQRVARLCQRYPLILQRLQRAPSLLQDAFDTEQALRQLGGMFTQLRVGARAGGIVLAAELTDQIDRVEAAALKAIHAEGAPTAAQATLRARLSPQEQARLALWSRVDGRRQRAARRQHLADEALARSREAQALLEQEVALRGQPATGLPAPPKKAAPRGRKARGE